MLFRMIKNSIFKNKIQKSLVFLTCFLSTALVCSMLNITLGIGNEMAKELRSYGSNILVLPEGSSLSIEVGDEIYEPLRNSAYLEEKNLHIIKEIFWRNNISAFAPFLDAKVNMGSKEVLILGTYFNKHIQISDEDDFYTGIKELYPYYVIQGQWAKDDSLDEVMLGDEFAMEYGLKIADEIVLNQQKVKIVGIIQHSGKNANKIITSLALAQKLSGKEGLFARAEVSALTIPENDLAQKARRDVSSLDQLEYDKWYCTAYVGSIAYQIEEEFKGASAKAQIAISDAESSVVKKIQSLMALTAIICLIVASIAISSLINSEFYRRKKEIGLLKVLGANSFQIHILFMGENSIIALLAAICGFVFGIALSELISLSIFGHFIALSFITLPICMFFSVLIANLGCFLGLRKLKDLLLVEVIYGK